MKSKPRSADQKSDQPPRWLTLCLEWLVAPHLHEQVLGDLHERYARRIQLHGKLNAQRRYFIEAMSYMRPIFIRRQTNEYHSPFFLSTAMIKNYYKIAFRNLFKNKVISAINICGLALGILCCLFIFLWVQDENAVDHFLADEETLYAMYETTTTNGKVAGSYAAGFVLAPGSSRISFALEQIDKVIPEIKYQAYYATGYELPWGHPETFQVGDKKIKLEGSRAGEDFFKIFSYKLIEGTPETALKDIGGVAISRHMAEMFFGSPGKAMGQIMRHENRADFKVTAVFENLPRQSSLKFDYLFNWEAQKTKLEFASNEIRSYLKLTQDSDPVKVEAKINQYLATRLEKKKGIQQRAGLIPFYDQYLHSTFENGKPEGGRIEYVRIFTGVGLFILAIACINFMNLSTARSVKRAKEVGLRKVVGSSKISLASQFLGESLLFTFLAMLVAVAVVLLLLPSFNTLTGKDIQVPIAKPSFWIFLLALLVVTGLVAGSYPALYLSSLEPVRILKGVVRFTRGSLWFRQGLTVFQFTMSIVLLIATIVISGQTRFVQNKHLGYDRDNLVYIRIEGKLAARSNYLLFKERVSKLASVAMVDRSTEAPHDMGFSVADAVNWEGKEKNDAVYFSPASVGMDFVKLMNLKVVQGRGFSKEMATDSTDAFLINEEALRQMGMKDPIGKWISAWAKKGHIIGVLKDYHVQSMHEKIKPVVIDVKENEYFGVILIRTKPGKTTQALAGIGNIYKEANPDFPFNYQFLDQEFNKLYRSEQVIAKLSNLLAPLAIMISSLGLLGLALFSAEQRIKEIGIRKVLGASIAGVVSLLSKDFLKLVLIAICIATPVGWYLMNKWLQGFAYKIEMEWWVFAAAATLVMTIAILTVSFQSFKAALMNPVKSLRSE
ncbi:permease prefix domain 2-containing transporter [Dyadobacter chenwenxiniae]|uniref:Permease prefix domain 2-containing transporter n=1 Tax=Dyadobacter chenwenxiniae TaxID=2906456 RepID=A0A9X1TPS6_9BACT|nr:ABC transporter permease [Dyadobacter chenwenxiniae]MCF0065803.1 permease prefix domain 2-containing transporter [Dyadobacter chenwenxiniae]UON84041.1 permease prefix domain 2-containing transporter [Dyadobacter chenwenxiniae]